MDRSDNCHAANWVLPLPVFPITVSRCVSLGYLISITNDLNHRFADFREEIRLAIVLARRIKPHLFPRLLASKLAGFHRAEVGICHIGWSGFIGTILSSAPRFLAARCAAALLLAANRRGP